MLRQLRREMLHRLLSPPYELFDGGASYGAISIAF